MTTLNAGPWIAYKRPEPIGYAEYEIHYGTDGECVAEVVHGEGNAKLLAAAPDLLEALRRLLDDNDEYLTPQGRKILAREAIAKATGEM